ncbi:MAG TPA: hypothetical protein DCY59_13385 [Micrococcaceae bacterium]|nr:hypothetical protein [Micrococcaceae bacterium]
MNVEPHTALELLKAFSRIEFALKQIPEFVNGAVGETPDTQWSAFYVHVRMHIQNQLSQRSKDLLLGTGPNNPPPMKMQVCAQRRIEFVDAPLGDGPEGDRLMDAARRVRNNLVHGGKEHARQQRYPKNDDKLARAAIDVMYLAIASHPEVSHLAFYD